MAGDALHSGGTDCVSPVQRVLCFPLEQSQTHESQFTVGFFFFRCSCYSSVHAEPLLT